MFICIDDARPSSCLHPGKAVSYEFQGQGWDMILEASGSSDGRLEIRVGGWGAHLCAGGRKCDGGKGAGVPDDGAAFSNRPTTAPEQAHLAYAGALAVVPAHPPDWTGT